MTDELKPIPNDKRDEYQKGFVEEFKKQDWTITTFGEVEVGNTIAFGVSEPFGTDEGFDPTYHHVSFSGGMYFATIASIDEVDWSKDGKLKRVRPVFVTDGKEWRRAWPSCGWLLKTDMLVFRAEV